jgi:hypothetical protein
MREYSIGVGESLKMRTLEDPTEATPGIKYLS